MRLASARFPIRFASGAAVVFGFSGAPLASAQTPVPVGGGSQVNTYTTSLQRDPSVAADADGDFVVVWESDGSSGTDTEQLSIQGQRYDSNGLPQGLQFQVNTGTTSNERVPSVAAEANGDFVVVWHDTYNYQIHGQRYASNGSALGSEFQINTAAYVAKNASVGMDPDGDFVVVWQAQTYISYQEIVGRRFDSNGSALGGEFPVNSYTTGGQNFPSVAAGGDGSFVVVWAGAGLADGIGIHGQRFDSIGGPQGPEFLVNSYTTNGQEGPSVAADADGDFVVAWQSFSSPGTDNQGNGSIQGRRFTSNGSPQGAQFQVNTYTSNHQFTPSISADAIGDFVVTWYSDGSSGTDTSGFSTQGQRYSSNGSPKGIQFQINTYTTNTQFPGSVAAEAGGDFVVAWWGDGSSGTDTSYDSVHAQRFSVAPIVSAMSSATRFALAGALLLLGAAYALRRRA